MKLYLKGDYPKEYPYGYLEPLAKCGFQKRKAKYLTQMQETMMHYNKIFCGIYPWGRGTADRDGLVSPKGREYEDSFHILTNVLIEFENAFATVIMKRGDYLHFNQPSRSFNSW